MNNVILFNLPWLAGFSLLRMHRLYKMAKFSKNASRTHKLLLILPTSLSNNHYGIVLHDFQSNWTD